MNQSTLKLAVSPIPKSTVPSPNFVDVAEKKIKKGACAKGRKGSLTERLYSSDNVRPHKIGANEAKEKTRDRERWRERRTYLGRLCTNDWVAGE